MNENIELVPFQEHARFASHVIEYMSDPAFWAIADGSLVYVNRAACQVLGYGREEFLTLRVFDIFPGASPKEWKEQWEYVRQRETLVYESLQKRRDGLVFPVEIHINFISFEGTECICGIVHDISDRKTVEKELRESEARLRELNATKDKFFSIIAHDLKSPFNSIVGFSNLLVEQLDEKDYEGIEKYAEIIRKSSYRAMDLLKNLLEWSRIQTGRVEFNPEFLEMITLINEEIALISEDAIQKSITIEADLPHNVPVYADNSMLRSVIKNLLSNAVKYSYPENGIHVSLERSQKEITFTVTDHGIGIKPERLVKLFRIDESFSSPGTAGEHGTGLGLILCQEFVKQHQGRLEAKSIPGKGSSFSMILPAARS